MGVAGWHVGLLLLGVLLVVATAGLTSVILDWVLACLGLGTRILGGGERERERERERREGKKEGGEKVH